MATRAYILRKTETGYEGIYNHFDGYPSNMLPLLEHYKTEMEVKELIGMGYVSSLAENLLHSNFYHRDRKEELKIDNYTENQLFQVFDYVNHVYLYENGQWSEITKYDLLKIKYSKLSEKQFDLIFKKLANQEDPNSEIFPDLFELELKFIESYNQVS